MFSCKKIDQTDAEKVKDIKEKEEIELEFTVQEIDSLRSNNMLSELQYPNMSACGGALKGFYYKDQLVLIDATYSGELSYTRKKMYVSKASFSKIIYQEHFPEMDKYRKEYPLEKYKFDPSKVTFADTIYEINIGQKDGFKKRYLKEILSKKADSTLIVKLLDCGEQMKLELVSMTK